eukprot:4679227-Amphidinium_carterae.1
MTCMLLHSIHIDTILLDLLDHIPVSRLPGKPINPCLRRHENHVKDDSKGNQSDQGLQRCFCRPSRVSKS